VGSLDAWVGIGSVAIKLESSSNYARPDSISVDALGGSASYHALPAPQPRDPSPHECLVVDPRPDVEPA